MFLSVKMIIKETHRGLWFEDGKFIKILPAGRYRIPLRTAMTFWRPVIEVDRVDIRELDFTIKGQEILTADKVAIRVSILVRYRVTDPRAARLEVENYYDRLYSDVQLAARRSLVSMKLEEILTNRNRLSEDILADVKESAHGYGVSILRADVKDLIFPGNIQDVMNRVLTTERLSEAEMVDARTKSEIQRITAATQADIKRKEIQAEIEMIEQKAKAEAEAIRIRNRTEIEAMGELEKIGSLFQQNPALLRLHELRSLQEMSKYSNARIYIGLDKYQTKDDS
ncbi:MAG: hypothetical protein JW860_00450 [Sedimentisphaerales bacterium]|nr:hypothetical protein [Sedimentisphaerales bacterium]